MLGWVHGLSVRARALLFASILLFLLVGLGLFSLSRLTAFHDLLGEMGARWAPGWQDLNDVGANSERYRNLQNLTLVSKTPAQKESVRKRFNYVQDVRAAAWERHVRSLTNQEQKALAQTVELAWMDYLQLSETLTAFHVAGQDDEALAFSNNELQQMMDKYRAALHAYLDYYVEAVQITAATGDDLYRETRLQIIAILIFAIPLCLLGGFSLSVLWS